MRRPSPFAGVLPLPARTQPALDVSFPEYARRAGYFVADAIDLLRAEQGVEAEDLDVLVDDAAVDAFLNGYAQ